MNLIKHYKRAHSEKGRFLTPHPHFRFYIPGAICFLDILPKKTSSFFLYVVLMKTVLNKLY